MSTADRALTRHRAGSGPPLVLLHGLGLSWRAWLPVLGALEGRHEVFALDLPGFGASPRLDGERPPTPEALADAVEAELDRLGIARPTLVGNSLGGWIALELARRRRARRVVAIAPAGLETPPERAFVIAMNQLMRLRARAAAPLGRLGTALAPGRVALLGGVRSRPWRVAAGEGASELRAFGRSEGFQPTLRWTLGASAPKGLGEIDVPVRVVFGTLDVLLAPLTSPRFVAAIPGAELVPLSGVGHVPMSDDPAAVARAILDFTARS